MHLVQEQKKFFFPSSFPNPRRAGAKDFPSPISFSIPQTSRVSNAPVLRNIRRSSGSRNHRLLSRETALEGTLSSRKIRGAGGGRRRKPVAAGLTPSDLTPSPAHRVGHPGQFHLLGFYPSPPLTPAHTGRVRKGGGGGGKGGTGVICEFRASARSRLHPTRTIVPGLPTPTPDRK